MGLFSGNGGLTNAFQSAAATVANLAGQAVSALSFTATQAAGAAGFILQQGAYLALNPAATHRILYDGTNMKFVLSNADYLTINNATGQVTIAAGSLVTATNQGVALGSNGTLALGAGTSKFTAVNMVGSVVAPTISSGFGTSPSVAANNGTFAFTVNVGGGGVATSGVIGLPTATNGWVAICANLSSNDANHAQTKMTANGTTSVTVGNFTSGGVAGAWNANDIIAVICMGY